LTYPGNEGFLLVGSLLPWFSHTISFSGQEWDSNYFEAFEEE
jgi:hypothetical protein